MANANTVTILKGGGTPTQGANAIPAVVPSATSAFIVTNQAGNAATAQVGNSNAQPTGAQTYGSGFDGFRFRVRVAWKVTTKANNNVTVAIVLNTTSSTTYTAGNVVATTGATANNTVSQNGWLDFEALWDSTSTNINGFYQGMKGTTPTVISPTVQTDNLTVSAQSSLIFSIAATFSDTTSGTTMTITEFTAEVI